ncbi:MAG: HNH endonuclease [Nocardioides sp.]
MDESDGPEFLVRLSARGVSDEELLADVRRVAESLSVTTLTRQQYGEHGRYHPSTIHRRLGGWTLACEAGGLLAGRQDLGHSDDAWMENIVAVWTAIGRQPTYAEMRTGRFSPEGYANRYGSWRKALTRFSEWVVDANTFDVEPVPQRKRRTGRSPNLRVRFAVLQRDRFTCRSCGRSPSSDPGVTLHVDHVTPYSKGGETVLANLQTLCQDCNLGKSDRHVGD